MKELVNIQTKLKAPKGNEAKGQYGKVLYRYRSCEDILEAVKPLLAEQRCIITIDDDIAMIGNRFYVKATATIKNADGETVSTTAFAREPENLATMNQSQVTGAASSYARKYALNGLLAIDDTKDADALNTGEQKPVQQVQVQPQPQPQPQAQPQVQPQVQQQAQPQAQAQQGGAQRQWIMPSNYESFMAKNHPEKVAPVQAPQAPAQTADEIFAIYARPAIEMAQTAADLKRVYDNFSGLQGMPAFLSALTAKRKSLGIKGKND